MLLNIHKYKAFIKQNIDSLNKLLYEKYWGVFFIKNSFNDGLCIIKKSIDCKDFFTYNEDCDNSIELIDGILKMYVDKLLLIELRNKYLLDTIKRIWNIKKAEEIVIESIRKWYLE